MRKSESHRLNICLTLLAIFAQISLAWAHALDEAVWENQILENGQVESSLRLPVGLIDQFDKNGDGQLSAEEITEDVAPIIDKLIWIEGDGVRGKLKIEPVSDNDVQTTHTIVGAAWTFPQETNVHTFHYNYFVDSKETPKCIARFTAADRSSLAFVFTEAAREYEISPASRGFYGFFLIGVEHILLGFDHLLFVAVLMLAGGTAGQLFKMITAFTIAHSLTLALAVLDVFTLPGSIVEPIIALSIAVAAVENIRKDEPDNRWMMAAGFGLIHGMGFAGVLADMSLSGRDALVPLLGFNLGVEAGQLAVIVLALPAYYFISKQDWNRKFRIGGSVVAGLIAIYWTIDRVLG